MKKYLIFILLIIAYQTQADVRVLIPSQGGTGQGSATAGDVGKYLKVSGNSPFAYSFDTPTGGSVINDWKVLTINSQKYLTPTTTNYNLLSPFSFHLLPA